MIIEMQKEHIDKVMDIWLRTNIHAHDFIPESYWKNNFDLVKNEYIPNSKTLIYEDNDGIIKGFVSIMENNLDSDPEDFTGESGMIGALFVLPAYQGQGIGGQLLNYCKKIYDRLYLKVYSENAKAYGFYDNYGFITKCEQIDPETKQQEYVMLWSDEEDWYQLISTIQC